LIFFRVTLLNIYKNYLVVIKSVQKEIQKNKISTIFANIWMRMPHLYKKSSEYTRGLRTQKKNLNDPKLEKHVLTKNFTILSLSLKL